MRPSDATGSARWRSEPSQRADPWAGVVPPFRMLDPALSRAAELPLMNDLVDRLPDERAAAVRLSAELLRPSLARTGGAWRIEIDEPLALGILVAADGWRRLKWCACGAAFLDRTTAATRLRCDVHIRRGGRRSPPP